MGVDLTQISDWVNLVQPLNLPAELWESYKIFKSDSFEDLAEDLWDPDKNGQFPLWVFIILDWMDVGLVSVDLSGNMCVSGVC